MAARKPNRQSDLSGSRVLILTGKRAGQEGVCVGKSAEGKKWAISPDGTDEILQLEFEKEFGLRVDCSGEPGRN